LAWLSFSGQIAVDVACRVCAELLRSGQAQGPAFDWPNQVCQRSHYTPSSHFQHASQFTSERIREADQCERMPPRKTGSSKCLSRCHKKYQLESADHSAHTTTTISPTHHLRRRLILRHKRLHIPYTLRIFINTPITREEAHARHRRNRLSRPLLRILVALINKLLRLDVRRKVIRHKVVVAVVDDAVE
jgi:hypothetical protein